MTVNELKALHSSIDVLDQYDSGLRDIKEVEVALENLSNIIARTIINHPKLSSACRSLKKELSV